MNRLVETTTSNIYLPMVSVVVPIYNGEAELPELINCLLSQTYPQNQVEYLLVDNNSSDRTCSLLQKFAENQPLTLPRLEVGGFLVQPADLFTLVSKSKQRSFCPQA